MNINQLIEKLIEMRDNGGELKEFLPVNIHLSVEEDFLEISGIAYQNPEDDYKGAIVLYTQGIC